MWSLPRDRLRMLVEVDRSMPETLSIVLDAMGVIYRAADDVAELLVPYVAAHGGANAARVEAEYARASRGEQTAAELWRHVGLDDGHEDAYLAGHATAPDLVPFLEWAIRSGYRLACLSNDVSEWSLKLRRRFGLERYIRHWVISGDVRARKPEPRIYAALVARLCAPAESLLFVDDRLKNLDAARRAGLRTVLLGGSGDEIEHPRVSSLTDLRAWLEAASSRP
jgi:putative hydrolase of the HAD superfamily